MELRGFGGGATWRGPKGKWRARITMGHGPHGPVEATCLEISEEGQRDQAGQQRTQLLLDK